MKTFLHRLRLAAPLAACAFGLLAFGSARAEGPPIHLWGFQRGCERLPEMDKEVEKKLYEEGRNIGLLTSPEGKPLPACSGAACAKAFSSSCGPSQGFLLGGQVVQSKDLIKVRMWLQNLETGQTAYQDDFCQSCNLISALTAQARALLDNPQFGGTVGAQPSYCTTAKTAMTAEPGSVFLSVSGGSERQQKAMQTALKAQLEALQRPVYLGSGGSLKSGSGEAAERAEEVAKVRMSSARVLSIEIQKDGKVIASMSDTREQRDSRTVDCRGCDHEGLMLQVKQAVSELLDRCLGAQCAGTLTGAPPVGACEAYAVESCGIAAFEGLLKSPGAEAPTGRYIDSETSKIIKGSLWGLFAATAVTGGALAIVNETSAATLSGNPTYQHTLGDAAWTALGISAATLLVAVPVTLLLHRAEKPPQRAGSLGTAQLMKCPSKK